MADSIGKTPNIASQQSTQSAQASPKSVIGEINEQKFLISQMHGKLTKPEFEGHKNYACRVNQNFLLPLLTFTGTEKYTELETRLAQKVSEEVQKWQKQQQAGDAAPAA